MTKRPGGVAIGQMARLFGEGTLAGLTERQLLERFLADRDELAFAGLVERFGPMVAGVCRRWLAEPSDVEDAFQATFLVLVRRAGAIRDPDRLGNWLYGVAVRVASRARDEVVKRRDRHEPWTDLPDDTSEPSMPGSDLDEEIGRLPEKYRTPLVLCYLEGLTHEEAADRLKCPVGTVRSRMAWARERLRTRLTARASAVPAGLLAASEAALLSPPVPQGWVDLAGRVATLSHADAARAVSSRVATLTQEVIRAMFYRGIRTVVIAGVIVAVGTGVGLRAIAQQPALVVKPQPLTEVAPPAPDPFAAPAGLPRFNPGRISVQTELLLAALSPANDKVWGYSVDVGNWNEYQARKGTTLKLLAAGSGPMFGLNSDPLQQDRATNLIAVDISGDRIDQVAAFSNKSGRWRTQDLRSPAKGRVSPLMNATIVVYAIGRHVYAYSAPTDSWDILELPEGTTAQPYLNPLSIVVQNGDSIHVFSARTGKWQGVNLGK
jgi:RNA polymerase sigma factor (sigma-70 family)